MGDVGQLGLIEAELYPPRALTSGPRSSGLSIAIVSIFPFGTKIAIGATRKQLITPFGKILAFSEGGSA